MQSPYERFQASEAKRPRPREPDYLRDYCYAVTREEHEPWFKPRDISQLKGWLANIRKDYDTLVDPVRGFVGPPDKREKAENYFNRMIYIEDEIERRLKLLTPKNLKADVSMWRTKTKLLEERAAKRQKLEDADPTSTPRPLPSAPLVPSILGYVPPTREEKGKEQQDAEDERYKWTFNCTETLGEEEEDEQQ